MSCDGEHFRRPPLRSRDPMRPRRGQHHRSAAQAPAAPTAGAHHPVDPTGRAVAAPERRDPPNAGRGRVDAAWRGDARVRFVAMRRCGLAWRWGMRPGDARSRRQGKKKKGAMGHPHRPRLRGTLRRDRTTVRRRACLLRQACYDLIIPRGRSCCRSTHRTRSPPVGNCRW